MKKLILVMLMAASAALADNYAVVFYRGDTNGIPDGWPKLVRPLGKAEGPLAEGEELKTFDELADIRKTLQPIMDARDAAETTSKVAAVRTREQMLTDARKTLVQALANWDALTAAQQKAVLKYITQLTVLLIDEKLN